MASTEPRIVPREAPLGAVPRGRLRGGRPSGRPVVGPSSSVTLGELVRMLIRDPWRHLGRHWNYKSAVTSSLFRGVLFFSTNVTAGLPAAVAALSTEFWLRFLTAGYYGALTQAFRRVEPARTGTIAAMVVLPIVGHGLELVAHGLVGTPNLSASIGASVVFTAFSTSFNLFAMRRGAFIIGDGSSSLLQDLRCLPGLIGAFVMSGVARLAPLKWCPPQARSAPLNWCPPKTSSARR